MRKVAFLVLAVSSLALAAQIEVNGSISADYGTYWDKDFDPTNAANQDIDLSVTAYMDEAFSVTVSANTHSNYVSKDGLEPSRVRDELRAAPISDLDNRYTAFDFKGILLRWEFTPGVAALFGDLTYSAGSFSYYFWRDPKYFAVILREQTIRGIGFELGDGRVYVGPTEYNNSSLATFASYPFELLGKTEERLTITPSIDWIWGKHIGRSYTYALGVEAQYAKSIGDLSYGVTGTWGMHPYKGDGVHTFLAEPSFNYKFFNLALTYYRALLADDNAPVEKQTFTDEQMLIYVEPSFNLHKKFTLGAFYELHEPNINVSDDKRHVVGPSLYFYPTAKAELVFWGGYNIRDTGANNVSMGISGQVDF
ncbi:MAG: hypothetical protein LBR60_06030 [Fibrobacter sp.]|jgi:hypothetical protein|nr:hypothetical protein [Fibrobacter sp.]